MKVRWISQAVAAHVKKGVGGVALVSKYLCGKASDQPPGGGADMPEKDSMKWRLTCPHERVQFEC